MTAINWRPLHCEGATLKAGGYNLDVFIIENLNGSLYAEVSGYEAIGNDSGGDLHYCNGKDDCKTVQEARTWVDEIVAMLQASELNQQTNHE